jgi:hypothetical protein
MVTILERMVFELGDFIIEPGRLTSTQPDTGVSSAPANIVSRAHAALIDKKER